MEEYERELFRSIKRDLESINDALCAYYAQGMLSERGVELFETLELSNKLAIGNIDYYENER